METYENIYNRMKAKYEQESGVSFDEASDIAIRLRVLAGEIYNAEVEMEWIKRQMFAETATGENLDLIAAQRGIVRKAATKAQGELTFYIDEPIDHTIIIPKGTVAAIPTEIPIRYVTTEDGEISAGGTLVSLYAEAEQPGSSGNAGLGVVNTPVSVPSEISKVKNREPYTLGFDEETDEELRKRIRDSYIKLPNGTNGAYYEQLALSVEGVAKAGAIGKYRGNGTVDVFISGYGEKASTETVAAVQALLSSKRELNVHVKASAANMVEYALNVTLYKRPECEDFEVTKKSLEAFKSYINSISIGGRCYLSALGKALLDTGVIENYEFNSTMDDMTLSKSQCFIPGKAVMRVE